MNILKTTFPEDKKKKNFVLHSHFDVAYYLYIYIRAVYSHTKVIWAHTTVMYSKTWEYTALLQICCLQIFLTPPPKPNPFIYIKLFLWVKNNILQRGQEYLQTADLQKCGILSSFRIHGSGMSPYHFGMRIYRSDINIQGMVDGSASKPVLRQDTGFWAYLMPQ